MSEKQAEQIHIESVEKVQHYIRNHLDHSLKREVLADIAGYSVPHLHRIFSSETGETMSDYVRSLRLKRAGYKLRMGAINITEVALAAGYQTHAAFGKAFKQEYGLSPAEFRELTCMEATRLLMKGNSE